MVGIAATKPGCTIIVSIIHSIEFNTQKRDVIEVDFISSSRYAATKTFLSAPYVDRCRENCVTITKTSANKEDKNVGRILLE